MSNMNKKAKRILVVDDKKNIRLLLNELLDSMGYQVLQAKDGKEAMGMVEIGPIGSSVN